MSEIDYTKHWDAVIDKRNRRLQASDWTQIPDSPLTDAKKAEWATYRQALRDMPERVADSDKATTNPFTLNPTLWPTKPS